MKRWVDLSQPYFEGMPPVRLIPEMAMQITTIQEGDEERLHPNIQRFVIHSHQGTHIDAPKHIYRSGKSIDQFPVERFVGAGVALDMPKRAREPINSADLENARPEVQTGDIVLIHTGWDRKFDGDDYNDNPYLVDDAAEWLIRKGVPMVGFDMLTPDELPSLVEGRQLSDRIAQRKKRRQQLLKIPLPEVIFSDALDEIGNPPSVDSADEMRGLSVSVGVAEGIARVLLTPTDVTSDEINYVLVCPSTDPGWTLLFLNACALVMERGGMLSHGAVVAREYGIPAVVNISNATKVIRDRQKIRVDGNRGGVTILP